MAQQTPPRISECRWCGREFSPAKPRSGRPREYCPTCHPFRIRISSGPLSSPVRVRRCPWCAVSFLARRTALYCSRDHAARACDLASHDRCKVSTCHRCGDLVPGKTHGPRTCEACRETTKARKNALRREADRLGFAQTGERVTVEALAKRDGGACWICEQHVDLTLARNTRMGATVDHVVPVHDGGLTTMANSRLAHLVCNAKRRRGPGETTQLRLVG